MGGENIRFSSSSSAVGTEMTKVVRVGLDDVKFHGVCLFLLLGFFASAIVFGSHRIAL